MRWKLRQSLEHLVTSTPTCYTCRGPQLGVAPTKKTPFILGIAQIAIGCCYTNTSNLLHLFHQHLQHVTPVTPTYPTCTHVVTPTPPTCYTCYPVTPTSPTCYTCCYTNTPRLLHLLHQHLQLISGWCNLDLFLDAKAMLTKASLVSTTVSWSVPR